MDKLLCFCHFCELHGPNVILTTRCLAETDLLSYMDLKHSDQSRAASSLTSSMSSLPTNSLMNDNTNHFNNEIHLINDDMRRLTHDCDGCSLKCKSMDGFNGFLSFNDNKKFGFITNSYPNDRNDWNSCPISNAIIRDACIRSLSCEVYDSSEGLMYFGDQRAHTLSYLFVLRDSKARGFQRTYSILVMSGDKQELLNEWDFYVKHIEQIVAKLKTKAKILYESELTQTTRQQRRSLILDNVSKANVSSFEDIVDRNPLNTHRTNSKARSVLELTGDNTTFAYLHIQFSWILFAVDSRNDSNSVISSDNSTTLAITEQNLTLRHLYKIVGKEVFLTIAYNTVIGNKIIVFDTNKSRLKCFIHCLSQLLPEECISIRTDCHSFDESLRHNFIEISSLEILPKTIIESEFHVLIKINDNSSEMSKTNPWFADNTVISVHSKARLSERMPNYLLNVENILMDFSFSDLTFNSYLISLKNEWLNRAQIYYSYVKGVNPPRSQSEINSFMKLIQSEECDLKLITFWSNSGLNIEFKTNVFSLNSNQNFLSNDK